MGARPANAHRGCLPDFVRRPAPPEHAGTKYLFTGQEYVAALGFYNYKNRVYSAEIGRFLQSDPKRLDGGDLNLYRYCRNSPPNGVDPNGKIAFLIPLGVFAGKLLIDYAVEKGIEHIKDHNLTAEQREWLNRAETAHTVYKLGSGNVRELFRQAAKFAGKNADDAALGAVKRISDTRLAGKPSTRGRAPIGDDGRPVELHHVDQAKGNASDLKEMTRTEHRSGDNYKKNHPNTGQTESAVDREEFREIRQDHWEKEWDSGRFDRLSET